MASPSDVLSKFTIGFSHEEGSYITCVRRGPDHRMCQFDADIEDATLTDVLEVAFDHVRRYHTEELRG